MLNYNFGCGTNKIKGFINVDCNKDVKPDVVMDLKKSLPIKDGVVDQIVLYHTIEHIAKCYHLSLLLEFWRILKPKGKLTISYPEFEKIAQNWINNFKGQREFWEATIYGRQTSSSDFHVSLMDSKEFAVVLRSLGFFGVRHFTETEPFNSIISCVKGASKKDYSDVIKEEIFEK